MNADYLPASSAVLEMDVTRRFPFEDHSFNYVFSEHLIEHVTYANGVFMLAECYRILKPGGKIRISTPDFNFLADFYKKEKSALQMKYMQWAAGLFPKEIPYPEDVFVINNFVRQWGHLFIYDEKALRYALQKAGFADIVLCGLNESADPAFRHLENEDRMPEGFLKMETFTVEAVKK